MIKFGILIYFYFSSFLCFSQVSLSKPLTYGNVIKVDSMISTRQLYARCRSWFAESYRSAQDVIQMDDKENGKIIGKGNLKYSSKIFVGSEATKGWVRYTVSIQVKPGRYKYELTNFNHEGNPLNDGEKLSFGLITTETECPYKIGLLTGKGWRNKVWRDIKENIEINIIPLIESLKITIGKPADDKDSNW
jgi:hypothetical protein